MNSKKLKLTQFLEQSLDSRRDVSLLIMSRTDPGNTYWASYTIMEVFQRDEQCMCSGVTGDGANRATTILDFAQIIDWIE